MSDMLPRPEPRDRFKRALRAQLMAQAPGVLARRETTWTRFQGLLNGGVLRPVLVAAAIVVVVAAGAGRAAAGSLPGDVVYPLKVAAEQVQLAFALDDSTRLRMLADQADHRLAELAEAVSTRTNNAPSAEAAYSTAVTTLTDAVDSYRGRANVSDDAKTAAEDVVDAAHQKHEAVIQELKDKISPSLRIELDRAKEDSDRLHPSGRPVRPPEPAEAPDRSQPPQPNRTAQPTRTPEPGDDRQGGPTRSPQPTRTFQPARTAGPTSTPKSEGSLPPGPADTR